MKYPYKANVYATAPQKNILGEPSFVTPNWLKNKYLELQTYATQK
tara:strand:- start:427 stop:561 length:135 start_codon:yes stop_codon:yes gene_type:complete